MIACTNLLPTHSLYRWQGAIEEAEECVLIAKSHSGRMDAIIEKVRALHSYECPCIVSFPITAGNEDFLKWIAQETA